MKNSKRNKKNDSADVDEQTNEQMNQWRRRRQHNRFIRSWIFMLKFMAGKLLFRISFN